ncbi:MAG: transmembrane anchor protein [Alphaproteobacteria bacterium]|nr:transmembrane anchor protein [Alphaproteobacteria bacterium]
MQRASGWRAREYGIDPTGAGRLLGLTEMGQIKTQLSAKAEADRAASQQANPCGPRSEATPLTLPGFFISPASAASLLAQAARNDEVSVTLKPGQGTEIKLTMKKGAKVSYAWSVDGGVVNHDTHGERPRSSSAHSYKKGTGVSGDQGVLEAAFDVEHGWFWRNRGRADVTVRLKVQGDYDHVKRM